ncbi:hypothetical protein VOI54_04685 [Tamlana sp. 2201CG12-4]|uniref:hypothetical protein n=1 Tax=Tamlana sp. 2201CG12-4 TaxID=3112582 RepID=UPI002DB5E44A|nr:hypothetical protein [Tamlana sp. 2201CG12-4]MEC3906301.1 hypothetical protein [Tamlana sp. 2201CG12-4]
MQDLVFYSKFKRVLNEATTLYVNIISESISPNSNWRITNKVSDIEKNSIVITITCIDFLNVKLRHPFIKCFNWFQGVIPEESLMEKKQKHKYYILSMFEYLTLKFSHFNFFVSKKMYKHYKKKYNYNGNNFFIMPCFNLEISKEIKNKSFNKSLVYAGSMAPWQKVESILTTYKELREIDADFNLTILTMDLDEAKKMIFNANLEDKVECKCVELSYLQEELLKYKYGFLLRDDHVVNNVACPTKMNSYMASGVIPIYSETIGDFFEMFEKMKFSISIKESYNYHKIASLIHEFECNRFNGEDLEIEYQSFFENYYNQHSYIKTIRELLSLQIIN